MERPRPIESGWVGWDPPVWNGSKIRSRIGMGMGGPSLQTSKVTVWSVVSRLISIELWPGVKVGGWNDPSEAKHRHRPPSNDTGKLVEFFIGNHLACPEEAVDGPDLSHTVLNDFLNEGTHRASASLAKASVARPSLARRAPMDMTTFTVRPIPSSSNGKRKRRPNPRALPFMRGRSARRGATERRIGPCRDILDMIGIFRGALNPQKPGNMLPFPIPTWGPPSDQVANRQLHDREIRRLIGVRLTGRATRYYLNLLHVAHRRPSAWVPIGRIVSSGAL